MNTPQDSGLGRATAYPTRYDPGLLFPIPRAQGLAGIVLGDGHLPLHRHYHLIP